MSFSNRAGEFDFWRTQVGSGLFANLTEKIAPLASSGFIVRKLGFSGDNSEVWFNPGDGQQLRRMPWAGGEPRPFLVAGANTPAWSPDGSRVDTYSNPIGTIRAFDITPDQKFIVFDRLRQNSNIVLFDLSK